MKYVSPKKRLQRRRRQYVYAGIAAAAGLWWLSHLDYSSFFQQISHTANQISQYQLQNSQLPTQTQNSQSQPSSSQQNPSDQGEEANSSGSLEELTEFGSDPRFAFQESQQLSPHDLEEFEASLLEQLALRRAEAQKEDTITHPYKGRRGAGSDNNYPLPLRSPVHLSEARKIHFQSQQDVSQGAGIEEATNIEPTLKQSAARGDQLQFERETSFIKPRFALLDDTKRDALIVMDISGSMKDFLIPLKIDAARQKHIEQLRAQSEERLKPLRQELEDIEREYDRIHKEFYQGHGKICQELLDALSSHDSYHQDFPKTLKRMQKRIPQYIRKKDHCKRTLAARKREIEELKQDNYSSLVATLNALQHRQQQLSNPYRSDYWWERGSIERRMNRLRNHFRSEISDLEDANISIPSVAALAIARHYIEDKRTTVSGILFNNNSFYTGYTDDLEKLASFFSQYSMGGTRLNGRVMVSLASDPSRPHRDTPLDMYIISDFVLSGLRHTIQQVGQATSLGRVYVLEMGSSSSVPTQLFGGDFYRASIRTYEDLQDFYQHFVKEVKKPVIIQK